MKPIDEIARRTNLLALNTAVEAARAGEAEPDLPSWPTKCEAWPCAQQMRPKPQLL